MSGSLAAIYFALEEALELIFAVRPLSIFFAGGWKRSALLTAASLVRRNFLVLVGFRF